MSEGDSGANELRQSLTRLHSTLSASPAVDEGSKQLLRDVLGDIERLLKTDVQVKAQPPSSTLEALAARFEVGHPTLSASLRELVDLLGRAGL